jgi:mediator of RNA polymerase II transcription subunit 7
MPTSATPYPDPPAFYALYGVPDEVPPAPPRPPARASYASFGANHHTAPWHDPDHGIAASGGFAHPICVDASGKTDAREEIALLTRHATARFVDAMERCVDAPTKAEEAERALHALFNNAHKLINETIRPSQAMTDFEYQIERMIEEKRASVEALRAALEGAKAAKAKAAEASVDLGVEALKRALDG